MASQIWAGLIAPEPYRPAMVRLTLSIRKLIDQGQHLGGLRYCSVSGIVYDV